MTTDARQQGRLAFVNNHPMSSCEYPVGSSFRAEWMSGWTEARQAEERKSHGEPPASLMKDAGRATHLGRSQAHES